MVKKELESIDSPARGDVVWYEDENGVRRLVVIEDGEYWTPNGLSNFWTFTYVEKDGSLRVGQSAYGEFYKAPGYKLRVTRKVVKSSS